MVHRADVPVGKLGDLVLVTVAALQQAHGRHCAQEPGQLGVLGRVGLLPEHAAIGIKPGRQPIESHIQRVLPTLRRVGQRGHGVVVGDKVVGLALLLKADGREHGSEIIAQVQGAARLDASENAHERRGCGGSAPKGKRQNARNALNCCDPPETRRNHPHQASLRREGCRLWVASGTVTTTFPARLANSAPFHARTLDLPHRRNGPDRRCREPGPLARRVGRPRHRSSSGLESSHG